MNNLFAVPGFKLEYQQKTAAVPGLPDGMIPVAAQAPRLLADHKNVYCEQMTITATGCVLTGGVFITGVATILPTAVKCSTDKLKPLRENDSGICNGSFTVGQTVVPCVCSVKISAAGQTKAGGM